MTSFESGVLSYIRGRAVIEQYWPVDAKGNADITCKQCFYFRDASGRCGITGEVSEYPAKYVGSRCPLLNDEDFTTYIKEELNNETDQ